MSEANAHRVLVVIDRYWPEKGGAAKVSGEICKLVRNQGYRCSVLTRHYRGNLRRTETIDGIPVVRRGRNRFRRLSKFIFLWTAVAHMIRYRKQYDLVHVHLCQFETDLLPVFLASLITRKPYVIHFHAMLTVEWMMKHSDGHSILESFRPISVPTWLSRATLRSAEAIIVNEKKSLESLNGIGVRRGVYIPNGIDFGKGPVNQEEKKILRKRLGIPQDAMVAIFVGSLVFHKNIMGVQKAWLSIANRMPNQQLRLLILGAGDTYTDSNEIELRAYVKKHGLNSVEFMGFVSNVTEFLNASDVFVFPSFIEGMSLAVLEAMSCGLPVIVSDIIGMQELVPSEEYGLIVKATDSDALAEKLEKLFRDKGFARMLGQRSYERAYQSFSSVKMGERISGLYDEVLAGKNE